MVDFSKLTEAKPEVTFASKRQSTPKMYIIGIDPISNSRSHYDVMVYVVKEGRVVETRKAVRHERMRTVLEKIFKFFNRRSCKIIRNCKL